MSRTARAMLWLFGVACTHHEVRAQALILASGVVVAGQPALPHQLLHLFCCVSAALRNSRCVVGVLVWGANVNANGATASATLPLFTCSTVTASCTLATVPTRMHRLAGSGHYLAEPFRSLRVWQAAASWSDSSWLSSSSSARLARNSSASSSSLSAAVGPQSASSRSGSRPSESLSSSRCAAAAVCALLRCGRRRAAGLLSCSCCCAADGFAEPALLAAAGLLLPLRVILI